MIRCGIAGWIDKQLIGSGLFYPPGASSSEARLQFYASRFPMVEVDSTYYGMLPRHNAELWVARTDPSFRFDVKSFSLFTHHPTQPGALPPEIRARLPPPLQEKKSLYLDGLPPDIVDAAWDEFRQALEPLRLAGRLGAVFFQFPPWFLPGTRSLAYLEECQERMFPIPIAVEFRRRAWLDEWHRRGTLGFLRARDIPYVAVDTPQGFDTAMPPVLEATSTRLAVVRFHGRNHRTWNRRGAPPSVRFQHNYTDAELGEWVPRIRAVEDQVDEVHAIMNNNFSNWSVMNAKRLSELLAEAHRRGTPAADGPGPA